MFKPCCPQKTNLSPPRKQESSLSDCPLQPLFTTLSWPMLASIYAKWAKHHHSEARWFGYQTAVKRGMVGWGRSAHTPPSWFSVNHSIMITCYQPELRVILRRFPDLLSFHMISWSFQVGSLRSEKHKGQPSKPNLLPVHRFRPSHTHSNRLALGCKCLS